MTDVFVSGPIDFAMFRGLMVSSQGVSRVTICSDGGDLGAMLGMYDMIQFGRLETRAAGHLETLAAVLFQSGRRRIMTKNSLLTFTEPPKDGEGNFSDHDWYLHSKLVQLIQERTGLHLMEVHDLFDGKPIEAERAMEKGLCDAIQISATEYVQAETGENNG